MGVDLSMDPLSAGVGALSSVVGAIQSNKNIKRQLRAQAEENQKTRQYNLMLAQMQNAWNIEQWQRENEFNSPLQQRQRLAAAGMNADLAYSGGQMSNLAASSPAMTSGSPAIPQDFSPMMNYQTAGSITTQALQNSLLAAQIDKTKSETEGQNQTNRILMTDADIKNLTKGSAVTLAGLNVRLLASNLNLNDQNLKNLQRSFDEMGKNMEVMDSVIGVNNATEANIDQDTIYKKLQQPYIQRQLEATIGSIEAKMSLDRATARQVVALLPYMIAQSKLNLTDTQKGIYKTVAETVLLGKKTVGEIERNIQEVLRTHGIELTNKGLELDNKHKMTDNEYQEVLLQLQVMNQSMEFMNGLIGGFDKSIDIAKKTMK